MFLYCRRSRKACHWPCWKPCSRAARSWRATWGMRSEEHTSELQSQSNLVCRLLLEKKKARFLLGLLGCTQPHAAEAVQLIRTYSHARVVGWRIDHLALTIAVVTAQGFSGIAVHTSH